MTLSFTAGERQNHCMRVWFLENRDVLKMSENFVIRCEIKEICIQKFGVEILLLLGVSVIWDCDNIYLNAVPGNYLCFLR